VGPIQDAVWLGKGVTRRWLPMAAARPTCRKPISPGSTSVRCCMSTRIASTSTPASIRNAAGPAERRDAVVEALPEGISGGFGKLHVVHGHDNFPDGPLLYDGRTNLDTLAWRTGRLTVGSSTMTRRAARSISSWSRIGGRPLAARGGLGLPIRHVRRLDRRRRSRPGRWHDRRYPVMEKK